MCSDNGLTLLYGGDQHNAVSSYTPVRKREPREGVRLPVQDRSRPDGPLPGCPPLASPARTPPTQQIRPHGRDRRSHSAASCVLPGCPLSTGLGLSPC